ncbi:MAG: ABC transporter substrate-binding protein [Lachnospiraceae bacterium]|nr:ABC transporter substrate-binding protein [Lachnospiraceae bacterium]MBQ6993809.1 ABC transporter substrate-binding protein [Lachnospiraceae bacterium]
MKKLVLTTLLSITMLSTLLSGCSSVSAETEAITGTASSTETKALTEISNEETPLAASEMAPVTITNMDNDIIYTDIPERVVVLSYDTAEIMAALGLEDKIIALAPAESSIDDVLPKYQEQVKTIPIMKNISYGVANLEAVLALEPDFVYGASYSFTERNAGNASDYIDMGIAVYGSAGTYSDAPTLEDTYADILNMGKIFRVEDKANALVNDLKTRVSEITSSISSDKEIKVFVYDSDEDAPFTAGGTSLENELISLAGGTNIYADMDADFATVAWEDVIKANPDVIVINKYGDDEDAQQKIEFLKSVPELAEVTAIKENQFLVVSVLAVFPSIQNVDVIEYLANGIQNQNYISY